MNSYQWIIFKSQVKRMAGRYGCFLIHNMLQGRWMRYNIISFKPHYKCDICGREW